jgi:ribonuclease I
VSAVSRRLKSLEERIALQQHRELQRQFQGRSRDEQSFFIIHGFWPENAGDTLPTGIEFTVRGIKTVVITQWADEDQKT